MREEKVSEGGILAAVFLALVATVGTFLTHGLLNYDFDWVWLTVYGAALLTLSGAVVGFDMKRLVK